MENLNLSPWELLAKTMIWEQIGSLKNKNILDFGSGEGVTSNYFAKDNIVVAIEPSYEAIGKRKNNYDYVQKQGSIELVKKFSDETFDIIICHNVLEYVPDIKLYSKEHSRVLKKGGKFSIVKHNPAGRVMQIITLLNNFAEANSVLNGENGTSLNYGTIQYYNSADITKYCPELSIYKVCGIRTFWDLQQNQKIQTEPDWQQHMLAIENRVSTIQEYQNIAFFHHLIFEKNPI